MSRTKFVSVIALCLAIAAPAVFAGDPSKDAADRQQARDHATEVHRMKENTKEHGADHRSKGAHSQGDPMERARERNKKAEEKDAPKEDADDDAVDGTD